MRRGLDRYDMEGHDWGPLARQRYVDHVIHKAGVIPGDWVLDVQTADGMMGNSMARRFARVKVVATDENRALLVKARENARGDRCVERMRFVQCAADALPFKEEVFFFVTIGPNLDEGVGELSVLEDVHRVTGFTGKVIAPHLEYPAARKRPADATGWLFDADAIKEVREMGYGKIVRQRVTQLTDGGQLHVVAMKRFDSDEDIEDEDEE